MNKDVKILMEVYRKVYAELGVDIDALIEEGVTQQEEWFMNYEMQHDRQKQILEEVLDKYKIPEHRKKNIRFSYWLGSSPKNEEQNEEV